jgi:hypothetical protein
VDVTEAYVLVQAEPTILPISSRLGAVEGVAEALDVSGPYDALVLAAPKESFELDRIVAEIRALPGVLRAIPAQLVVSREQESSVAA